MDVVDIVDSDGPGWQTAIASPKFNALQQSGSYYVAIPADIKLALKYEFYIRATTHGGKQYISDKKTLDVALKDVSCPLSASVVFSWTTSTVVLEIG